MRVDVQKSDYIIPKNDILFKNLNSCILRAGDELYLKDQYLITCRNSHVAERSIVFRYGIYLEQHLTNNKWFSKYNLDCEYNRNLDEPKYIYNHPNGSYPDLILHKRASNEDNLLVIECKGYWAEEDDIEEDREKIKCFLKDPYRYRFGLLLIFQRDGLKTEWYTASDD